MAQNIKHIDDITQAMHANQENNISDVLPEQQIRMKFTSQEVDMMHSLLVMQIENIQKSDSYPEKFVLIQLYEK